MDSSSRTPIWGVTIDDTVTGEDVRTAYLDETVDALRSFARRPTARVVFDHGRSAASYRNAVAAIHAVSGVMGEIVDSQFVSRLSLAEYEARVSEYLHVLGRNVDIWEIGNEVNGEWLGASDDVVAKIDAAYGRVKRQRGTTAITLYYNEGCWSSADHEMFTWTEAKLPARMKEGLDYVLVSYYEDDCNGQRPDWPSVFRRLAKTFPYAALGFGECGTTRAGDKERYLERYYRITLDEPRFIGGYFWWYFSQDMVPRSRPLWTALNRIMLGARGK